MDSKGMALANVQRKIEILRSTIERRIAPDETIDAALNDLDCEVALLRRKLKEN